MTSQGLFQTIPPTFHDPLQNAQAAVNYTTRVYSRPRQAGKATAIDKAIEIAKHVKSGAPFADGGFVPGPADDTIPTILRPGEYVLTPEDVRNIAADIGLSPISVATMARVDEILADRIQPPPPPDLPDLDDLLPTPPVFDD